MSHKKYWFKVSAEITSDPEVWGLTDLFGDRSLRAWLKILSVAYRKDGRFTINQQWIFYTAQALRLSTEKFIQILIWMHDKQWITSTSYEALKVMVASPPSRSHAMTDIQSYEMMVCNYAKYQGQKSQKEEKDKKEIREEESAFFDKKPPALNKTHADETGRKDPSPTPSRPGRSTPMVDAEFIEALRTNPAYRHVNLSVELCKMDAWLLTSKGKRRTKTRQFIVNWLNRIDAPLPAQSPRSTGPSLREVL